MTHKLFEGKLSPAENLQLKHDGIVVRKDGNIVMTASYLEKCGKWDGVEKVSVGKPLSHSKQNCPKRNERK